MSRLLTQSEVDIVCTERPDVCKPIDAYDWDLGIFSTGTVVEPKKVREDGYVFPSRALGFHVLAFWKTDGSVIFVDVQDIWPEGRGELPAPPGFWELALAQAKRVFLFIRNAIIFLGVILVIYLLWESGLLRAAGERIAKD